MFKFAKIQMKKEALILLRASFLTIFAMSLFGPFYAIFVQEIGGDILDIGFAYAIFSVATGLFILIFGTSKFFSENVRLMVVLGYIFWTIGYAGYFFVQNPVHLFLVQVILGIAGGILEPSWDSVYAAELGEAEASFHWSLWSGGQSLITGAAAFLGSFIVAYYSFGLLFVIMFAFNLLSVIVSLDALRNRSKATKT